MDYKVIYQLVQKFRSQRKNSRLVSKEGLAADSEDACSSHNSQTLPTETNISSDSTIKARIRENTNQLSDIILEDKNDLPSCTAESLILENNQGNENNGFIEEGAELKDKIVNVKALDVINDVKENNNNSDVVVKETDAEGSLKNQMTCLLARLDRLETRLLQITRVQSLTELIEQLHMAFSGGRMDEARVQSLMEDYVSNAEDWRRYAKFNKDRYTRNLVDEGNGKFNLILLCWSQGQMSSVHDHAQAHCFMKMLQGSLTEVRYQEPKPTSAESANLRPLSEISRTELNENDVCYINDSIGLHKVGNAGPHPAAVSLHLYSPPFDMCSSFDPQTGKKSLVQMSFYSKFGREQ